MDKKERIEKLLDALEIAQEGMDATTFWPCYASQVEAYLSHFLALDLLEKFKKNKKKFKAGLAKLKISILRHLFYSFAIIGLKVANQFEGYKIPTRDMVDFAICLLDVIKEKSQGNEYCLDGKEQLWRQGEIKRVMSRTDWKEPKSLEEKRLITHLIIDAEALVWALFYDFLRQGGVEIHGPYETTKGALLVRDFFDLNPPIWKVKNKHPRLKMCLLYDPTVKIKIDFVGHLTYQEAIVEKLKRFLVSADKKSLSIEEIKEIDRYYANLREKQVQQVESMPPLEIVKKGVEIYYYLMKGFYDFYGEDWHPPKEVYDNINRVGLRYWRRYKPKKKEKAVILRKLYDPRVKWVR